MANKTIRDIADELGIPSHAIVVEMQKRRYVLGLTEHNEVSEGVRQQIIGWFQNEASLMSRIKQHLSSFDFAGAQTYIQQTTISSNPELDSLIKTYEHKYLNEYLPGFFEIEDFAYADHHYNMHKAALRSIDSKSYLSLREAFLTRQQKRTLKSKHYSSLNELLLDTMRYDKLLAAQVRDQAKKALGIKGSAYVDPDYFSDNRTALQNMISGQFFAKVEVDQKDNRETIESITYLVTKNRLCALLGQDDWFIISWTSPVTSYLLDKPVSSRITYRAPQGEIHYKILSSATYGSLLPFITDATYYFQLGKCYVDNEQNIPKQLTVKSVALPAEKPLIDRYEAKESFSLTEIIELADSTQRSTMHLPFYDSMIIEGPPGSGKTSIGIMRIPCLIDRQWQELSLDPSKDTPFHQESTMRVLVNNNEMIKYLDDLTKSIGIQKVKVMGIPNFLLDICRKTQTLKGLISKESLELMFLKTLPSICDTYWLSFVSAARKYWDKIDDQLRAKLGEYDRRIEEFYNVKDDSWYVPKNIKLYSDIERKLRADNLRSEGLGQFLHHTLESWLNAIEARKTPDNSCNLALHISKWQQAYVLYRQSLDAACKNNRQLETIHKFFGEAIHKNYVALCSGIRELYKKLINRGAIIDYFQDESFNKILLEEYAKRGFGESEFQTALSEWKTQIVANKWSEYDLVLQAYLGIHLSYLNPGKSRLDKPENLIIGCFKDNLTHIVIDEAQDISIGHAKVCASLLQKNGTLTFAGDLHQRVNNRGFFDDWKDLGVAGIKKVVFSVNFRQTKQIGTFLKAVYNSLFHSDPGWKETSTFIGPGPRVLPLPEKDDQVIQLVATEIRFWRTKLQDSTIGILFAGETQNNLENRSIAEKLEHLLDDLLIQVSILGEASGVAMQTNQVIVSNVQQIKGLEFDIVIFVDLKRKFKCSLDDIDVIDKNSIYVAISRGKYGLSSILPGESDIYRKFTLYAKGV